MPEALRGRAFAAYNGAELGALALGGVVVGAFGARTGLLVSGVGPAAIGLACLLYLNHTLEGSIRHARVQSVVVLLAVRGASRSMRIRADLLRLQDTTAQIRVRGAMVLLVGFAAIAEALGLEAILGAFAAGAILILLDGDEVMTHPQFRRKLEAIGFGFFIPVFFVTTGVRCDLDALLASSSTVIMVPIFLAALLVRGLPALLDRRLLDTRKAAIAGLPQTTSLRSSSPPPRSASTSVSSTPPPALP